MKIPNVIGRDLPRRCYIDLYIDAELAIRNALLEVEKLPADIRLTNAVVLLSEAMTQVNNFVDDIK